MKNSFFPILIDVPLVRLLFLITCVGLSSCSTFSDEGENKSSFDDPFQMEPQTSSTNPFSVLKNLWDKSFVHPKLTYSEPAPAAFQGISGESLGACKDDIYTQYLMHEYKKSHKRRGSFVSHDLKALHFAHTSIHGPESPYFGGIPVTLTPEVQFWIKYYKTSGRYSFLKWLVRAHSLAPIIEPILKEEGVPPEFVYMAMIESGFSNSARSRVQATGSWQFMKGTALLYGLKVNYWVDERHDLIKSTRAAAQYLRDMYEQFGDWYLTMAAYNSGPGTVAKAVRRGKSENFWDLRRTRYLPRETKNYVPKVLAALILGSNPKAHGFEIPRYESIHRPELHLTAEQNVELHRPVQIADLAKRLGVSESLIKAWNPELIRTITPPPKNGTPYSLRLPAQEAEIFQNISSQLAYVEIKDVHLHKVRSGDTLGGIARKYGIKLHALKKFNPKISPRRLRIGRHVAVPIPSVVTVHNM